MTQLPFYQEKSENIRAYCICANFWKMQYFICATKLYFSCAKISENTFKKISAAM